MREVRAPFAPDDVVREFAVVLRTYELARVSGDYCSAQFVVDAFARHGITYERSLRSKSELYSEILGPINSGRVQLLDVPVLKAQILALERRVSRGGADSIDHPPRGRDDVINAAAGALVGVLEPSGFSVGGFQVTL